MRKTPGDLQLTLLTNDAACIEAAAAAGVERIGVDIERIGKSERQRGLAAARISDHTLDDLDTVARLAPRAIRFVRLNPLHTASCEEIDAAIDRGAGVLMLPQFRTPSEVREFLRMVRGRAKAALLVETWAAMCRIDLLLAEPGIDEVMVGMNDLHLEALLGHPLEVCVSPLMERLAESVRARSLPFGFGAVASLRDHGLPIAPDLILARLAELGATNAWISRSFLRRPMDQAAFVAEIREIRARYRHWCLASTDDLAKARDAMTRSLALLVRP